jgi:electron transport complex protein RnfB
VIRVEDIDAALPQTQCTRCGEPDCRRYAEAVAAGAPINRCPPGGDEGVARLAHITGRPVLPLDPEHGIPAERGVARIDEAWCIGCTLCIQACPVDAIVGASKQMHVVIEADCTGCELCIPVCPVDCIELPSVTPGLSGWAAWSADQARTARMRYQARTARLAAPAPAPPAVDKSALIAAALARAKSRA